MSTAQRQHRSITRQQLLAAGLGARAIDYRVWSGRLHRVHHGVYTLGTPVHLPLERAAAAVLACGRGALLSGDAALALWGYRRRGWPREMEVTVSRRRRRPGIRVHVCRTLTAADRRRTMGIDVTSLARTLLDCAPRLTEPELSRIVNEALLSGRLRDAELEDVLARCSNHPGARRLRGTLRPGTRPTRSEMEERFLSFCARHDLPQPQTNARVAGYEVDALFTEEQVIVELDGWSWHRTRASFEADRERDAETLASGHPTVRITWARLRDREDLEAARLRRILARRVRRLRTPVQATVQLVGEP